MQEQSVDVEDVFSKAKAEIEKSDTIKDLYDLKVKYFGKQGTFSAIMRQMAKLPKEERPLFGKRVNEFKTQLESLWLSQDEQLKKREMHRKLEAERLDMTFPSLSAEVGSLHPITQVTDQIVSILAKIGFSVRLGPMIEKDWFNFEALNIPDNHPSRDDQDTFYIEGEYLLRTQTSPIQIHTMTNEKPPLRVLAPGSVFRSDSDISHSPNFHQIEALLVEESVSMANLKGVIAFFVKEFFGSQIKVRFRPSFFPFTEPSAEVDCSCPICKGKGCRMCKNSGWIEIGGCGLVHPKVLENCGISSEKWQGFAFGFGVERMAIIKHGIGDIKLFSDNHIEFLNQFKSL